MERKSAVMVASYKTLAFAARANYLVAISATGSSLRERTLRMASTKKIRVAIVGLGFGAEFIPIYQKHPNAEMYAVCRRNKAELDRCADRYKIAKRYTSYEELLGDPNVDAVHINSPIPDHGPQSIAALKAGKHVACTVPMATTKEQIR